MYDDNDNGEKREDLMQKNVIEQKKMEKKPCVRVDWCERRRFESDKVNSSAHPCARAREWFTNKTTITFN